MASSTAYRIPSTACVGCSARDLEFDSVCATGNRSLPPAWHRGPSSLPPVDCAEPQYLAHVDRNDIADLFSYDSTGDALRRHPPYALRHSPARRSRWVGSSKTLALAW